MIEGSKYSDPTWMMPEFPTEYEAYLYAYKRAERTGRDRVVMQYDNGVFYVCTYDFWMRADLRPYVRVVTPSGNSRVWGHPLDSPGEGI